MSDARSGILCWALLCLLAAAPPAAAERRRAQRAPQRLSVVETNDRNPTRLAAAANTAVPAAAPAAEAADEKASDDKDGKPAGAVPAAATPPAATLLAATLPAATLPATTLPAATGAGSDAQQYCANIASAAADARYAWQAKQLAELEGRIKQRIADLETKQTEYRTWLQRREDAIKAAEKGLVGIYSKMRPEAASQQLSALDDATAAAVLGRLSPRNAGAILNEMDTRRAARLANAIAGHVDPAETGSKKQP